jgi:hypothetical protein
MVMNVASAVPYDPVFAIGSVTTSTGQVVLNWTINALTNTTNAPAGFKVYRATGATSTAYTLLATINDNSVLTYTDTTVAPITTYRYIVLAFNIAGTSPGATVNNITTGSWTLPTVVITPLVPSTFVAPASIPLTATTTAVGSSVSLVEYYSNGTLVGSSTVAPLYAFNFANLGPGAYSLTARVYSVAGASGSTLSPVVALVTTPAPTLISPTGNGVATSATFNLNALTGATGYNIWLQDYTAGTGGSIPFTPAQGGTSCSMGTGVCSFTTPLISGHAYGWAAAGVSGGGTGPWSPVINFFVGTPPATPVLTSPTGAGVATTAKYNLIAVAGATNYVIWLQDFTAGTGGPTVYAASSGLGTCGAGTGPCVFTPSPAFTAGHSYGWAAASQNGGGTSPYSATMNFFTGTLPVAPVITTPSGTGLTSPVTFVVPAIAGATGYVIWLQDNTALTGAPHILSIANGGALCGTTGPCNFSIPLTSTHLYTWGAAASNGGGTGPYSNLLNFTAP